MSRYVTLFAIFIAALVVIFHLAGFIPGSLVLVLAVAIILMGIGVITGL